MENTLFRKYDYPLKGGALNVPLIKIRGRRCECCQNTEWLGQPINLQVHHIDGDRSNNVLENLQLLCPNCHSYTDNFGIKNNKHEKEITDEEFIYALRNNNSIRAALFSLKLSDAGNNYKRANQIICDYNIQVGENLPKEENKKEENFCCKCGIKINNNSKYCISCYNILQRTVERPSREELKKMIRTLPFTKIAEKYNVSDKAIVKWCIAEGLPFRKKDIKIISEEEWNKI